mmetsp:Transcript_8684/g.12555  ORF Transcript_8684/g.12555 Transcript_8684/m.12555 type:complete len:89 (+) Transcript_8684:279-545(+)
MRPASLPHCVSRQDRNEDNNVAQTPAERNRGNSREQNDECECQLLLQELIAFEVLAGMRPKMMAITWLGIKPPYNQRHIKSKTVACHR